MAHINGNEIYFGIIGQVKGAGEQIKLTATAKGMVAGYQRTFAAAQAENTVSTDNTETEG